MTGGNVAAAFSSSHQDHVNSCIIRRSDNAGPLDDPRVNKVPATPAGAGNIAVQYYNLADR